MSEKIYDFDSPLDKPKPFQLMPAGIVGFTVTKYARARKVVNFRGAPLNNGKPIHVAVVTLHCKSEDGTEGEMDTDLPLHDAYMFKLFQFFTAIGQREHGDETDSFTPNWTTLKGSQGFALIVHVKGKKPRDDGTMPVFANLNEFFNAAGVEDYLAKVAKQEEKAKAAGKDYFND